MSSHARELDWIDTQHDAMRDRVIAWANINSFTFNLPGLAKLGGEVETVLRSLGAQIEWIDLPPTEEIDERGRTVRRPLGRALRARKRRDAPKQLFLGIHLDTVYPADHPFQRVEPIDSNTLRGPGVIDAKGGLVVLLTALEALERSDMAENIGWEVLLNPDEEIGSPGAAAILEESARSNQIGLVFEPAIGDGNLVDSRKGSGVFSVIVHGVAAHAGRDFTAGRNAIALLSEMITHIHAINDELSGIIVNVGRIEGGGAVNVVPDLAIARINVRTSERQDETRLRDRFDAIIAAANRREGFRVELHGGFSSPPKALNSRTRKLLDQIIACGRELDMSLASQSSGGTSDGNKLAAAGLAVIDSMGPRGGKLHSPDEFLLIDSLTERAKLTALVLLKFAAGTLQDVAMVIVRPVHSNDLKQLEALAALTGVGLTTLPKDHEYLANRIRKSERAMEAIPDKPAGESYLFVMEDLQTHAIIGTSGIVSKVGGFEPFYAYRIDKSLFHSDVIGVNKEVPILRLHAEHDGPAEIGTLFLHPDFRGGGNGRLLQLARFLFVAEHPQAFEQIIVSEIRGVSDEQGRAPFWDAVGKHFFDIDFRRADYLSIVNKRFIADLMPDHPIYIPLLPKEAQEVIGHPHEQSRGAVRNLEAEGFTFTGMVNIFDAGPTIQCERDQVRTVKNSQRLNICQIADEVQSPMYMLATTGGEFRACQGPLEIVGDEIRITRSCAEAMKVNVGDALRFAPLPDRG